MDDFTMEVYQLITTILEQNANTQLNRKLERTIHANFWRLVTRKLWNDDEIEVKGPSIRLLNLLIAKYSVDMAKFDESVAR
jgi:hypothetical protein